jgi:hypothetical protein
MGLRAIHLGPISDSTKTILAMLEARVEVVLVNAHPTLRWDDFDGGGQRLPVAYDLYSSVDSSGRDAAVRRLRFAFALSRALASAGARQRDDALAALCDRVGPIDFIFAHWGSGITPEIALLRRSRALRDVPVVLNFEALPTGWQRGWRERFEFLALRRTAGYVDATLLQTPEMAEAVERSALRLLERPHRVEPLWFPRVFQASAGPPRVPGDDGHDVVFTGYLDFSRGLNDVRDQLLALAGAGLTTHCSALEGLEHPNLRFFERFGRTAYTTGALADFMRRFRASLVTFNVEGPGRSALRFRTSLPTRLLFTLAVGVPVLVPAGAFPPIERLIEQHGIGYAYASPESALRRLRSADWTEVQSRAYERRERFLFQPAAFLDFVRDALGLDRRPGA